MTLSNNSYWLACGLLVACLWQQSGTTTESLIKTKVALIPSLQDLTSGFSLELRLHTCTQSHKHPTNPIDNDIKIASR